jgi:hypothetical protein
MTGRPVQMQDTVTVRVPADVGLRLRTEAANADRALGEVVREYIAAGVHAIDAQRKTATSRA